MKFDHIIMNPPYCRNLHLKILNEAICYSDDVVNLSPIRWLQDPIADHSLSRRKDFGQFFTPPELSIKMLEKFENTEGTILDPCCGAGNLLAAAIKAGFDPAKVYGIEIDEEILKIAQSRLEPLGVPCANIHLGDALNPVSYNF